MSAAPRIHSPGEAPRHLTARETAIALLERGYWPVALYPVGVVIDPERGPETGKRPIGKGWGARQLAREEIEERYRQYPRAGIGVCLGPGKAPGGGWLLDAEVDGPEGEGSLGTLTGGEDVPTLGWSSARGPHRLYSADPARMEALQALADKEGVIKHPSLPGLELRVGKGRRQIQSACPPTVGTDGEPRRWDGIKTIAGLPDAFYDNLGRFLAPRPAAGKPEVAAKPKEKPDPVGAYAAAALAKELEALRGTPKGERNNRLNAAAFALGQLVGARALARGDVERALEAAAAECGLGAGEARATIASGLDAGMKQPRDLAGIGDGRPRHEGNGRLTPGPTAGPGDAGAARAHEAGDDPFRLARVYRDQEWAREGGLALRYWQGDWHAWDGGAYRAVSDKELRAGLGSVIKAEFDRLNAEEVRRWADDGGRGKMPVAAKVTEPLKTNAMGNLASLMLLPSGSVPAQPAWIDGPGPWPAEEVLPAKNALLHLSSLVTGEPARTPPTPRFFSTFALGFDYDEDAPEPVNWLTFLGAMPAGPHSRVSLQLWPDDRQSIDTLQEWFGLQLLPDTQFQKILAMIGPKRCGKGTIARIMRALVGPENVAGPTLSGLATNFGLAPLIGKHAAIISDARLSGRADAQVIVERLLSISGEDALTVDRKHMTSWTGKLPTRFTILSNELPRLSDSSGALAGRFILLRFTRSFYGKEDRGLTDLLMTELPGILLWAIAGWRRLRERGYFLQPETGRGLIDEMEDLASPIGAFLKERCAVGPGHQVMVTDLFAAWKRWCESKGREHPGDEQGFGRNLRAALPHLTTKQRRVHDGSKRFFEGIALDESPEF